MGKTKRKIIRNETEVIITDRDTGEIINTETIRTHAVEKEPDFIKLYLNDVGMLVGLSPYDQKVFLSLVKHMTYSNLVVLIKPVKEEICNELGIKLNTINKAIDNLKNANLLMKYQGTDGQVKRSCWLVNPYLAAKGTWTDIRSIRLQIEYSSEGRKVHVTTNPDKSITTISSQQTQTEEIELKWEDTTPLSL